MECYMDFIPSHPDPAGAAARRRPQVRLYRFLLLFGACLLGGFGLLLAPPMQPAVSRYSTLVVTVAARVIGICGGHVAADGDLLSDPASGFAIRMANGCNGAHVTILLWAAVLAFPASLLQKAKGLLAGTGAIHVVNLIRFISLYYLGMYSQQWFQFAHMYLWESLMMLDTLVVFWGWAYLVGKSGSVAEASPRALAR
jgi:exosortase H (IPTLxxWG-CTERM-specific)